MSNLVNEILLRLAKAAAAAILGSARLSHPGRPAGVPGSATELALLSWLSGAAFILLVETGPLCCVLSNGPLEAAGPVTARPGLGDVLTQVEPGPFDSPAGHPYHSLSCRLPQDGRPEVRTPGPSGSMV